MKIEHLRCNFDKSFKNPFSLQRFSASYPNIEIPFNLALLSGKKKDSGANDVSTRRVTVSASGHVSVSVSVCLRLSPRPTHFFPILDCIVVSTSLESRRGERRVHSSAIVLAVLLMVIGSA